MPYAVAFEKDAGYVLVKLLGEVSRKDHEQSTKEATHAVRAHRCHELLVDASEAAARMPLGSTYKFVSSLPERYPVGIRIALVVHEDDYEYLRFVENVARNRGLMLRLFKDLNAAKGWIAKSRRIRERGRGE